MRMPTRIIKWFARGRLDPLVPDAPRVLRAQGLEAYLHPADLLLRGEREMAACVRAVLVRYLTKAPAYLVADPQAQHLEDNLHRLWDVVAKHRQPKELGAMARQWVRELVYDLKEAGLPFEDWVLLYSNLHQLERAVCGGPHLVDPEPGHAVAALVAAPTAPAPPAGERATTALVREAIHELQALVKAEFALARAELRRDAAALRRAAITLVLAVTAGWLGMSLLLIAWAQALFPRALPSLITSLVLLAGAAVAGVVAYRAMPRRALVRTRARLAADVRVLKERVA